MGYRSVGTRPAYPLDGAKRLFAEINLSSNVAAKQSRYHDRSALGYSLHVFCHVSSAISVEILLLAAHSKPQPTPNTRKPAPAAAFTGLQIHEDQYLTRKIPRGRGSFIENRPLRQPNEKTKFIAFVTKSASNLIGRIFAGTEKIKMLLILLIILILVFGFGGYRMGPGLGYYGGGGLSLILTIVLILLLLKVI